MSRESRRLLIVAASGRALARSAAKAGWSTDVIDAFADLDTRAACMRWRRVPLAGSGLDPRAVLDTAQAFAAEAEPGALIYAGGADGSPELIERLAESHEVLGNQPEVLRTLRDPRQSFALFADLSIPVPEVRFGDPGQPMGWLVKTAGCSGGRHVTHWRGRGRLGERDYLQRYTPGEVYSALFLADGERARILGWNRLWPSTVGFAYRGAIGRAHPPESSRSVVADWIGRLVRELGLKGLNGVDFIVDEATRAVLLELNPRPTATLDLYDADFPRGLVQAHIDACRGVIAAPAWDGQVRAHRIVYSTRAVRVPDEFTWPNWCTDLPEPGTAIPPQDPICSVHAAGTKPGSVLRSINQREARMLREAGSWPAPVIRRTAAQ